MRVLGLDLASHLCGYTCGSGHDLPVCDVWELEKVTTPDGADYGLLLSCLKAYMDALFRRFPDIGAVGYESPILITRANSNRQYADKLSTLRLLYPMGAFVEWLCRDVYGVPCHEIGVQEAKAEITGKPHSDKEDIAIIAERCGIVLPKVGRHDAGDSFAVWKRLLRGYDRQMSDAWDQKIWSKKGALL